jgi:hypothetical protein
LQDAYPFMPSSGRYFWPVSPKFGITCQLSLKVPHAEFS